MAIDLGDIPTGSPPTEGQKSQMREILGANPKMVSIAASPTTGQTITSPALTDSFHYLTPTSSGSDPLATLTFALPSASNSRDMQVKTIFSTKGVTTLTVTAGSGATMGGATLVSLQANSTYSFCYVAPAAKWIYLS